MSAGSPRTTPGSTGARGRGAGPRRGTSGADAGNSCDRNWRHGLMDSQEAKKRNMSTGGGGGRGMERGQGFAIWGLFRRLLNSPLRKRHGYDLNWRKYDFSRCFSTNVTQPKKYMYVIRPQNSDLQMRFAPIDPSEYAKMPMSYFRLRRAANFEGGSDGRGNTYRLKSDWTRKKKKYN